MLEAPHEEVAIDFNLSSAAPSLLSMEQEVRLIEGARYQGHVSGLTHRHYKYPARFSPKLAEAAIQVFTSPGDLVGDPFVGGGTTLVEAMAAGRRSWGGDISTLAAFVSAAKTTILSERQIASFDKAMVLVASNVSMKDREPELGDWVEAGYFRNMGSSGRWRLRKAIAQAVNTASTLDDPEIETLARCAILRTSQWALEGNRHVPTLDDFRDHLAQSAVAIAEGCIALRDVFFDEDHKPQIITAPAKSLHREKALQDAGAPRLLLTSPPYPGVHVLYHRWQVDGRRETPTPFLIADALDGSGDTYYTMGGRKKPGLPRYFADLQDSAVSLARMADRKTMMVQVLAFSHPEWQLPKYLAAMSAAGWTEFGLDLLSDDSDGRLWRDVPGRRWYTAGKTRTNSAREVVLFHRKAN